MAILVIPKWRASAHPSGSTHSTSRATVFRLIPNSSAISVLVHFSGGRASGRLPSPGPDVHFSSSNPARIRGSSMVLISFRRRQPELGPSVADEITTSPLSGLSVRKRRDHRSPHGALPTTFSTLDDLFSEIFRQGNVCNLHQRWTPYDYWGTVFKSAFQPKHLDPRMNGHRTCNSFKSLGYTV